MKKGFTLIELLVVVAIIGILSTIVVSSLNSARDRARVAKIQATLNTLQSAAVLYSIDNNTFEGLCTYADGTVDASIQNHIDALEDIAGEDRVTCIVRTADVPRASAYLSEDQLERKNFAVSVYYNEEHYAVDTSGIMMFDKNGTASGVNWNTAIQECLDEEKRLPSIEAFMAVSENGASGMGLQRYWSSTNSTSSPNLAYRMHLIDGQINIRNIGSGNFVLCVS